MTSPVPKGFVDTPFSYHEEITLEISDLTNQGQGVGRIDNWVIFINNALPGDTVLARIFKNFTSHSEADLINIIEASPDRVEAKCDLFGACGGCQYQNLSYEKQLYWKRKQVKELLSRITNIEVEVAEVTPSPLTYGYRTKITPHFDKPKSGKIGEIGFLKKNRRRELVDVRQCPIASDTINKALPDVRSDVHNKSSTYKRGATLLLRDSSGTVLTDHRDVAKAQVGKLTFRFLAGDFFQNNESILEAFTSYVTTEANQGDINYLVDAYCGSGLFGLSAASHFQQVVGIEISETSLAWAKHNAEANEITNANFVTGSAENIFSEIEFPPNETAVIIDPPRKGSTPNFLEQLCKFAPQRVVYISCNPATQARDLNQLLEASYQVTKVQPFDLFPQTKHLECIITLDKQ